MGELIATNDGTGVTGWRFKRADEIQIGDMAFLVLNIPVKVLNVFTEVVENSGVTLIRFQIYRPYNDGSMFVARLAHELIVYEIREEVK